MSITERQKHVLDKIISIYAKERQPVGSKSLMANIDVSSATIRNDMKVLEDAGFIEKPHTSSGRVPSIAGYRYFVENDFELEELTQTDLFQVMKAFDGEFVRLSDLMKTAADTLSALTGLTTFVLNVPQREQELRNFELVLLDSHSVLAVFTLSTGEVRTNQFILPRSLSESDLQTIKQIVAERLLDKKILEIHYSLRTEIPQIVSRYFTATRDVLRVFDIAFDGIFEEKMAVSGKEKVLPQLSESEIAQEIRLITDNDDFRTVTFDDKAIFKNLTVMSQKFLVPYRGMGTISLVGPIDLDYPKVMSALDLAARILTMKLTDYYRYLDGNHYEVERT
ncbi:MAG: heat-inducible transcriptional repressor HrcA [Streptococcaceae bacterium]|jgi:heat-inducible transcriptional repressor|nr:heat-inducible transcriptional repressor HrcA [Streptococcaceae bacterium]